MLKAISLFTLLSGLAAVIYLASKNTLPAIACGAVITGLTWLAWQIVKSEFNSKKNKA